MDSREFGKASLYCGNAADIAQPRQTEGIDRRGLLEFPQPAVSRDNMLLRRTPARVEREKEEARVDGVVTPDSLEKLVSKHDTEERV